MVIVLPVAEEQFWILPFTTLNEIFSAVLYPAGVVISSSSYSPSGIPVMVT